MSSEKQDETMPANSWEFDGEVTSVFDNMLARSIPQYNVMREACFQLAKRFRQPHTDIVDLGCSRGGAIAQLVDTFGATNHFVGLDVSEPMLKASRERFAGYIESGTVKIENLDLRTGFPEVKASVILCVLTLQFTPIEHRLRILRDVHQHLVEGGVFILVEKILGASATLDEIMVDTYYDLKRSHGYSDEQIERKRLSLEGVLVPVTAEWNNIMLKETGFLHHECFWRWMNFAGWMAIR